MSDEDFLARWARRKRAVEEERQAERAGAPQPAPPDTEASSEAPGSVEAKQSGPREDEAFDLASLPPIESITAETDVTAFLRKGVPPDLARAALRRAWVADPVIRDFVGLAENSWDFNDPTAIPGFGPLEQTPEQVRRMLSGLLDDVQQAVGEVVEHMPQPAEQDSPGGQSVESVSDVPLSSEFVAAEQIDTHTDGSAEDTNAAIASSGDAHTVASQHDDVRSVSGLRRSHGSALPQ